MLCWPALCAATAPAPPRCDGSEPQRKYYDKLARLMPTNTMVLTMGCGKFRIFDQDFGNLPGTDLPRLMDMGQCNDSYSALVVAMVRRDAAEAALGAACLRVCNADGLCVTGVCLACANTLVTFKLAVATILSLHETQIV